MYNNLKNNIQTGNDRINRLKSKILSQEYNKKYNNNVVNYNRKNDNNDSGCNTFFNKLPYIQNNSDKLLIARGFFDCSRNNKYDKPILNSHNNYYSRKTSNNNLIYNSGNVVDNNDLSFNTMIYNDISENKDIFIIANPDLPKKTRKQQLDELNTFSEKYENTCNNKVYKQSSIKIHHLISGGINNAQAGDSYKNCDFLNPEN